MKSVIYFTIWGDGHMRCTILLAILILNASAGFGQVRIQTYKPLASDGQYLSGPGAESQGYFGFSTSLSVERQGMVVKFVAPGGPADRVGVRVGDMLKKIGGQLSWRDTACVDGRCIAKRASD